MANSLDLQELSLNKEFRDRTKVSLSYVATQIVGEDSATPDTAQRQKYANQILNNVDNFVHRFAQSIVTLPEINSTISVDNTDPEVPVLVYTGSEVPAGAYDGMDVEIATSLSAVFNDLAGIYNLP